MHLQNLRHNKRHRDPACYIKRKVFPTNAKVKKVASGNPGLLIKMDDVAAELALAIVCFISELGGRMNGHD